MKFSQLINNILTEQDIKMSYSAPELNTDDQERVNTIARAQTELDMQRRHKTNPYWPAAVKYWLNTGQEIPRSGGVINSKTMEQILDFYYKNHPEASAQRAFTQTGINSDYEHQQVPWSQRQRGLPGLLNKAKGWMMGERFDQLINQILNKKGYKQ